MSPLKSMSEPSASLPSTQTFQIRKIAPGTDLYWTFKTKNSQKVTNPETGREQAADNVRHSLWEILLHTCVNGYLPLRRVFSDFLKGVEGCEAIMDDTIVYGKTLEEHYFRLKAIRTALNSQDSK
ncbi:hypothetical protein PoB_006926500 [Plakobranchus ocellatus]|uniref:Uncharacterized protein n=1 Tax=Plakobranchus ocellatus TaxID=259542 RepID=A0AAV4DF92_9GAST|nr:hypothetical protein PoB_006926500 [Plakobranchus ocellatus]